MSNQILPGVLSDSQIKKCLESKKIEITGYDPLYIGPSSVDLHLHNTAMRFIGRSHHVVNVENYNESNFFVKDDGWNYITIHPSDFLILSSIERIKLPNDIAGFMHGRSSLARLGLNIHAAGFFDPGFDGMATLEVANFTKSAIKLPRDIRICQMVFISTSSPVEIDYAQKKDSKYQGQTNATGSKIKNEFTSI